MPRFDRNTIYVVPIIRKILLWSLCERRDIETQTTCWLPFCVVRPAFPPTHARNMGRLMESPMLVSNDVEVMRIQLEAVLVRMHERFQMEDEGVLEPDNHDGLEPDFGGWAE